MEWKNKKGVLSELWNKYKGGILILLAGLLLLTWPAKEQTTLTTDMASVPAEWETLVETERRMEHVLKQIKDVGRLSLMLTLESSAHQELAADTELSYRGNVSEPEEYSRRSELTILSTEEGESPVVAHRVGPVYRGAVVVCEGAENPGVRLAVTQAVAALTGLGSDRIMVIQCQS